MSTIRSLQNKVRKLESAPGLAPPLRVVIYCLTGTQGLVDRLNADHVAVNSACTHGVHVTHALAPHWTLGPRATGARQTPVQTGAVMGRCQ